MKKPNLKAAPHNCVCGLRPIFCPIRAGIKGGNTYSIPALLSLSYEAKSLAECSCQIVRCCLNLSYHEQDGVLLPNICISDQPEDEQPLGRYGRMALAYLRENHPERYAVLKMDGNLMKTMHRVQRDALERMEHLTQQMLLDDPVPETEDLLERARHWNDLKSMAEKIVLQTTVFRVR